MGFGPSDVPHLQTIVHYKIKTFVVSMVHVWTTVKTNIKRKENINKEHIQYYKNNLSLLTCLLRDSASMYQVTEKAAQLRPVFGEVQEKKSQSQMQCKIKHLYFEHSILMRGDGQGTFIDE